MIQGRIRTTLRLHRFELVAFALAFIVFAGGTFLAAAWIASLTPPLACFGIDDGAESPSVLACRVAKRAFDEASGMTFGLTAPLLAITYVVGLFLGCATRGPRDRTRDDAPLLVAGPVALAVVRHGGRPGRGDPDALRVR